MKDVKALAREPTIQPQRPAGCRSLKAVLPRRAFERVFRHRVHVVGTVKATMSKTFRLQVEESKHITFFKDETYTVREQTAKNWLKAGICKLAKDDDEVEDGFSANLGTIDDEFPA